ncbi:MAG: hypothetical protein ACFFDF_00330 [Candidatus Odinarchaeota archaeon]
MAGILGQKKETTKKATKKTGSILGAKQQKPIQGPTLQAPIKQFPTQQAPIQGPSFQDRTYQYKPELPAEQPPKLGSLGALKAVKEYFTQPKEQLREQQQEFAKTPLGAAGYGLADTATLGLNQLLTGKVGQELYQTAKEAQPIPYTVGQAAGYILPGAAATKITAPLTKLATKKVGSILGKKVIEGAIAGTALETTESILRGKKPKEAAKDIATGLIVGAVADVALHGLGKVGQGILKKISKDVKLNNTELKAIKELPKEAQKEIVNNIPNKVDNPLLQSIRKDLGIEPTISKEAPILSKKVPTISKEKLRKFPGTAIKSEITSDELKKLISENPQKYNPTTDALRTQAAKEIVDTNSEAALKMVTEGDKFNNSIESFVGIELVPKLENEGRIEDALNVIEAISRKGTKAGQEVQSMRAWSKLSPQGMVSWTKKVLNKSGIKADEELQKEVLKQMNNINSMDIDIMKQSLIDAGLKPKRIEQLGLDKIKEYNIALVQKSVIDKIPVSLGRKISTYQAISHLLNPRTVLRNIFGNTSFAIAEQFSKIYGMPIDMLTSLKTGKRTISLPRFAQSFKNGLKQAQFAGDEVTLGIELGEKGKYELFRGETFKQPVLNKLEKALSRSLKVPDEAYKGYVKSDSLYQMLRSRLGKQVDNWNIEKLMKNATAQEIEQASQEAKYATFQDNSWIAQVLQGTKELANKIPLGKISGKQIPGTVLKSTREFGVGDLVVKYTRVPGNIISRGLEYSPLGALKAIKLASEIKDNPNLQREFALTVGRILNGSTLMGLSYMLAKKGIIVSEDKTQSQASKKLAMAEGLGNSKINISAITRIIKGGDGTLQKGDILIDLNWLQPLNVALSVGSSLYYQNKKQGKVTFANLAADVMENAIDLPSLYTIQSMFYEGLDESPNKIYRVATVPLRESLGGFIPSTIRQTAQTMDTTYRRTQGNGLETAIRKAQANVPILSRQLEPKITPIGTEATRAQEPLLRGLNLISPGQLTEYKPIPYREKLDQLSTVIENVNYPTYRLTKKLKVGNVTLELTDKEQTKFQKIRGQVTNKLYERALQNVDVNSLSEEQAKQLNKLLSKIKDQSYNLAKSQFIKKRVEEKNK